MFTEMHLKIVRNRQSHKPHILSKVYDGLVKIKTAHRQRLEELRYTRDIPEDLEIHMDRAQVKNKDLIEDEADFEFRGQSVIFTPFPDANFFRGRDCVVGQNGWAKRCQLSWKLWDVE
jgi:hypothetical protein